MKRQKMEMGEKEEDIGCKW